MKWMHMLQSLYILLVLFQVISFLHNIFICISTSLTKIVQKEKRLNMTWEDVPDQQCHPSKETNPNQRSFG